MSAPVNANRLNSSGSWQQKYRLRISEKQMGAHQEESEMVSDICIRCG